MKHSAIYILLLFGIGASLNGQAQFVVPVKRQQETIEMAKRLLDTGGINQSPAVDVLDPFNRLVDAPEKSEVEAVVDDGPVLMVTDKEVLQAASNFLQPSGFVNSNGEEFLIINGRKVKAGTRFDFPFKGQVYRLQISDITKTQFTLKLNQETITLSME